MHCEKYFGFRFVFHGDGSIIIFAEYVIMGNARVHTASIFFLALNTILRIDIILR